MFSRDRVSVLAALTAALVLGSGAGAQQPGDPPVNWARARDAVSKFRAAVDASGLVPVDSAMDPAVDRENLAALCQARKDAIGRARARTEAAMRELPDGSDPVTDARRAELLRRLGEVATFSGDIDTAIPRFQAAYDAIKGYRSEYPDMARTIDIAAETLAMSFVRRGEIENCLMNPGADQCLFPIRRTGEHHHGTGAQSAFPILKALAQLNPDDLEVRWLLNLTAMLIGQYPAAVPAPSLIPSSAFASADKAPRFVDVGMRLGLTQMASAGGTVTDDVDGDGLIDIVFSTVDFCTPLQYLHNKGDGTFEDWTARAGLAGQLGGLNIVQTDYNNDGHLDLFVIRGGWELAMRNSLLRNNGDGTFTDVTKDAGLSSPAHSSHSVAWADVDNDGWLDLFVGHELTPSQLFRNRGDGTFEDVTARAGVGASAFTKGAVFGDYDNDGFPDLYVSNMVGPNFLYHNNGNGTFTEVGAALGVDKPFLSFPTWFFDYDNDGFLDIFVASYPNSVAEFAKWYVHQPLATEPLFVYHNSGHGTFTNATESLGLMRVVPAMGSNFGDFDNDGYLDMYLGTGTPSFSALMPNIALRNDRGRRFTDVTEATGLGHLQKGHGVGFADLDNDGDEDIVLNTGGAVPGDSYREAVFQNPGGNGRAWLSLRLVGTRTNRAAIGATIRIDLHDARGRPQLIYRQVTSGGSFGSSPLTQHVGLGAARAVDSIDIYWPVSRTHQVFRNVPVNQFLEIKEGATEYTRLDRPVLELGSAATRSAERDVRN